MIRRCGSSGSLFLGFPCSARQWWADWMWFRVDLAMLALSRFPSSSRSSLSAPPECSLPLELTTTIGRYRKAATASLALTESPDSISLVACPMRSRTRSLNGPIAASCTFVTGLALPSAKDQKGASGESASTSLTWSRIAEAAVLWVQ